MNLDQLLKNWDIGEVSGLKPVSSYWGKTYLVNTQDGRSYILKEKTDQERTEQEFHLLSRLSEVGTPVAAPIRSIKAKGYAQMEGRIFCLYSRLPGEVISEHYAGDAASRAELLGKAIGVLHSCFLKCDDIRGHKEMQLIEQIQQWAIPCIQEHKTFLDGHAVEKIWQEVEQELVPIYAELPKQLIHRDLHPGNILFHEGTLTGFLDFEMVVRGPRTFDVCYCGTSLLMSGFPEPEKMQHWAVLFRSLVKGYQAMCPLTPSERLALYGTSVAIELLFAAFSLETQAEEAARSNILILKRLVNNREHLSI